MQEQFRNDDLSKLKIAVVDDPSEFLNRSRISWSRRDIQLAHFPPLSLSSKAALGRLLGADIGLPLTCP